jgi:predicted DCC family thiol-disulfide oxidoreductase YuxK
MARRLALAAALPLAAAFAQGRASASGILARNPPTMMQATTVMPLPASELRTLGASAERVFESDSRPVILFDGVCTLCNSGVNFMLQYDRPNDVRGAFRFAALQSEVGRALLARAGRQPSDISSIVVVCADGRAYTKSDAILQIGKKVGGGTFLEPVLPVAAGLGSALVPKPLRDLLYEAVAENRYKIFGEIEQCRLSDERFSERFISRLSDDKR